MRFIERKNFMALCLDGIAVILGDAVGISSRGNESLPLVALVNLIQPGLKECNRQHETWRHRKSSRRFEEGEGLAADGFESWW